jgi:hypothetical protein
MEQKVDKPKIGRPATGQMPKRYFRIADDDWQQIESAASTSGETTSQYVRRVLLKDSARMIKANAAD